MSMNTIRNLKPETLDNLQALLQINIDSAKGFKTAASNIGHPGITSLFQSLSDERKLFAQQLQNHIEVNEEDADTDGSWKGKCHRWWIELRGAVSDNELGAVLEEAERGEDSIKELYENVLAESSGTVIAPVLQAQYRRVKEIHDQIRDMRDTVKKS